MGCILTRYFLQKISKKVLKGKKDPKEIFEFVKKAFDEGEVYVISSGKRERILVVYEGITLFGIPLKAKKVKWEEIVREVRTIPFWKVELYFFGQYFELTKKEVIKLLIEGERRGEFYFWYDLSKMQIYVGEDPPIIVYALRIGGESPVARAYWSMAIKKKYAKRIFKGKKRWEIRKIVPCDMKVGDLVYVYVPKPIKAFVGTFKVGKVVREKIERLWEMIGEESGMDKEEFFQYFGKEYWKEGVGIEIVDPKPFDFPVYLEEVRENCPDFISPQNIMKVDKRYVSVIEHVLFKKKRKKLKKE